MYARILRFQVNPEKINDVIILFKENVIPMCKVQKGHMGAYFLADDKTGKCIPITLWKTEKDMLENERNLFFQEQVAKFVNYFTEPPIREAYEVVV